MNGIGTGLGVTVRVCATCPWLTENHGKRHPSGWYRASNLRRLWNGLRSGKAPGMVCHSSDPTSPDYGGTIIVKPDAKPHECAGALGIAIRYMDEVNRIGFDMHRAIYPTPFTRRGMIHWVERVMFGNVPAVDGYRLNDLGLPWSDVPAAVPQTQEAK